MEVQAIPHLKIMGGVIAFTKVQLHHIKHQKLQYQEAHQQAQAHLGDGLVDSNLQARIPLQNRN